MKKSTMLTGLLCVAFFTTCRADEANDSLDLNVKKTRLITDTASEICTRFSDSGESSELNLAAGLNAELSKLSRALAELGLHFKAEYNTQQHQGVLKEQVLSAIKESNSCKLDVLHTLLEDIGPSRTQPKDTPAKVNSQTTHGNGSHNIENVSGGVININAK